MLPLQVITLQINSVPKNKTHKQIFLFFSLNGEQSKWLPTKLFFILNSITLREHYRRKEKTVSTVSVHGRLLYLTCQ